MQVSCPNDIKIYNLSHGKSLPEFLSDHKRRELLRKDNGLRQRIELIQDFTMPTVSNTVKTTPDGQYVFATGTYKPRVKCFDLMNLSLKFERYLDAEVVNFLNLSDDYGKLALLLNDRSIEFHTQQGKHYKVRVPKFGRDLCYNSVNCDLMVVGAGSEIYRINLEQGQFLKSYETTMSEMHSCVVSDQHHLLCVGGTDGTVEVWDPRSRMRAGILHITPNLIPHVDDKSINPTVSKVKYHKQIELVVGTSTGQVMMYDMRQDKPYLVKDHRYDLPINSVFYNAENEVMVSSDPRAVKIWDAKTGTTKTGIEAEADINSMHLVEDSGLIFLANESPKIFSYFLPWLGKAPKWCSYLDRLVEGQEEAKKEIYDDYKFVTQQELESLGLSNMIGTNLLRAYMHGYFMNLELYRQAVAKAQPFSYEKYREKKLAEKVDETRNANRVKIKKAPKVNKNLAQKLAERATDDSENMKGKKKKAKIEAGKLLNDERFRAIFEDPDFEIDEESEEYRLKNPTLNSAKLAKKRRQEEEESSEDEDQVDDDDESQGDGSSDDDFSSDDEEVQERRKASWVQQSSKSNDRKNAAVRARLREDDANTELATTHKMYNVRDGMNADDKVTILSNLDKFANCNEQKRLQKISLEERIQEEEKRNGKMIAQSATVSGGKQSTFYLKKSDKDIKQQQSDKEHQKERRKVRRPAGHLNKPKRNPFFKR